MTSSPRQPRPRPVANSVNEELTPKRARPVIENSEYAAFARRVLSAYSRRIAVGDIEALVHMVTLSDDVATAISQAVDGLRAAGYSWAEIGERIGVTRQAAQQRWGGSNRQ